MFRPARPCHACAYPKKQREEISRRAFAVWFHDELRKLPTLSRGFDRWVDVTAIRSLSKAPPASSIAKLCIAYERQAVFVEARVIATRRLLHYAIKIHITARTPEYGSSRKERQDLALRSLAQAENVHGWKLEIL